MSRAFCLAPALILSVAAPAARAAEDGVRTVLALRSEDGKPKKRLTDPEKYIDPRYYKEALALH